VRVNRALAARQDMFAARTRQAHLVTPARRLQSGC